MWEMKEQEKVSGPRDCSAANGKSLPGSRQGAGDMDYPFPEARKARKLKFGVCHFWWLHWLWATTYPGSYRYVAQSFLPHMHPFTTVAEGLKKEKKNMNRSLLTWKVTLIIAVHPNFQLKVKALKIFLNNKETHFVLAICLKAVSLRCNALESTLNFV